MQILFALSTFTNIFPSWFSTYILRFLVRIQTERQDHLLYFKECYLIDEMM